MRTFKGTRLVNPHKPRKMKQGGYVHKTKTTSKAQANNDSVLAVLTPGELVIPKRLVRKTKRLFKRASIKFP